MKPGKPKFAIGDRVRISKYKRQVFDKGYTPNWTEEVFVIDKVLPTKSVTFNIDLMGEAIEGSFYEQELQGAKQQTSVMIEKVLKRDNKKKLALVKWSGYPDKFNSWVSLIQLMY